jgi:hypothetical protein
MREDKVKQKPGLSLKIYKAIKMLFVEVTTQSCEGHRRKCKL